MSTLLVNKQLQLTLDCPSMYPELFVCQTCKFLTMQWQFKKPFGLLIILGANQTITWITRSNSLFILQLRENHSSNEVQKAELKLSDFLNHTMFDKDHPYGTYWDYMEYMWPLSQQNPQQFLVVFYEDLKKVSEFWTIDSASSCVMRNWFWQNHSRELEFLRNYSTICAISCE